MKPEGVPGTPKFAASWSEVQVAWKSWSTRLVCEVRGVLWTVPLTCDTLPNSGQLVPELHRSYKIGYSALPLSSGLLGKLNEKK